MSACKKCGAPIWWARTNHASRMPIDHDPVSLTDGNMVLATAEGEVLEADQLDDAIKSGQSYVIVVAAEMVPETQRWRSHFATCPYAPEFRKRKA